MASVDIIFQIMLITIGMVGLSELLNKIFSLDMEAARELREKSKVLQEQMRNARLVGSYQEMQELQRESLELSKQMMKKQMIPSCVRCIIFWVIFGVIGVIYAPYAEGLFPFPILFFGTGWSAVYFLFSITFSLIIYGFKRLYRKLTGKEVKGRGILGAFSSQTGDQEQHIQLTRTLPKEPIRREIDEEEVDQSKVDSWKDRLKK